MSRPLRRDRDDIVDSSLTLRLTRDDRRLLDQLVKLQAARLRREGLEGTLASYVRGLIRREAFAQGLLAEEPHE